MLGAYRGWVRLRSRAFSSGASGAFAAFGPHSTLQLPVRVRGERRIAVGTGVFVGAGSFLQVLDGPGDGVALEIGDGTSITGDCVLSAASSIRIGRRVLIARNVYVADHRHGFADHDRAILDQGVEAVAAVEIDDGAWLGHNVLIGPGVRVGRGAVVGANAVVLSDVPDFAVAVGAPARVVASGGEDGRGLIAS